MACMRARVQFKNYLPGKVRTCPHGLVHSVIFIGRFVGAFDNMSISFLALVVELDHEVREIRYHGSSETTGSR